MNYYFWFFFVAFLIALTFLQFLFPRYFVITYLFFAFFFVVPFFVPVNHGCSYYSGFLAIVCVLAYPILRFEVTEQFTLTVWLVAKDFVPQYFPFFLQFFTSKYFYKRKCVWYRAFFFSRNRFDLRGYSRFR